MVGSVAILLLATACAAASTESAGESTVTVTSQVRRETTLLDSTTVAPPEEPTSALVRTTSGDSSGNRYTPGRGSLGSTAPIDIPLPGVPVWVVGAEADDNPVWVVALEDGSLHGLSVADGEATAVDLNLANLPPGAPPVIAASNAEIEVIVPAADTSALAPPLPLAGGGIAYISQDGELVIESPVGTGRFAIDALLDGRIVESRGGLLAVLTTPTDRYAHGVLGDALDHGRSIELDSCYHRTRCGIEHDDCRSRCGGRS